MSLAEERSAPAPASVERSKLGTGVSIPWCPVAIRCFCKDESIVLVSDTWRFRDSGLGSSFHNPSRTVGQHVAEESRAQV